MTESPRLLVVSLVALALVLNVTACGGDEPGDPSGRDADTAHADTGDTGVGDADASTDTAHEGDGCLESEAFIDGHCHPIGPGCDDGLDLNGDGICDRLAADWSRDARLPSEGHRGDIFRLGDALPQVAADGLGHTLQWPVDVTGVLLPWRPLSALLDPNATDSMTLNAQQLARNGLGFGNTDEMIAWLGLPLADGGDEALPGVPWPTDVEAGDPLGFTLLNTPDGEALTFSCATCHTANLFGRTVVGLTNRRAQANEFFRLGADYFPIVTPQFFQDLTGADEGEMRLFERAQQNLPAIGAVAPQVMGLDTSLAQVALSLSRRGEDAWATRDPALERTPRRNMLTTHVADSKPAVWWTLRYKTRWLSDGSIVSGNPIYTNFLWNELGRGTDLHELERWLQDNQQVVDELTAFAFSIEAPRWIDFFGEDTIDIEAAQRGQATFNATCATCHGVYTKGWETRDDGTISELAETIALAYHEQTPVFDVGTSPQRAEGMEAFADRLNELAISQWMETVVEVQTGYVPPPLDGIWSRYPYLHNQSVPTLCELLSPASRRTEVFWIGPDEDPETDFDSDCVGLPVGDAVPASWRDEPHRRYDTTLPGLSNDGHDEWLVDGEGRELLDAASRADLIEFLKTL